MRSHRDASSQCHATTLWAPHGWIGFGGQLSAGVRLCLGVQGLGFSNPYAPEHTGMFQPDAHSCADSSTREWLPGTVKLPLRQLQPSCVYMQMCGVTMLHLRACRVQLLPLHHQLGTCSCQTTWGPLS